MLIAKYEQIHRRLHDQIMAGQFADGKLPSLACLTKVFEANPATVSKAVKLLEQEKLVQCGPGSVGTIINSLEVKRKQREVNFYRNAWDHVATLRYCIFRSSARDIEMYQEVIRDFQEEYPGIEIELQAQYPTKVILEEQVSKVDVMQFARREQDFLQRNNFLIDIGKYAVELPPEEGFVPVEPLRYGIPFLFNTPFMIINRTLLSRRINSWSDLEELAETGGVILNLGTLPYFYHWIGNLKENLCDETQGASLRKAVELLQKIQASGTEIGGCRVPDEFLKGEVPVYVAYSNYLQELPEDLPFEYEILIPPLPKGVPPGAETVLNGISPECKTPVEAYLFIRYMMSAGVQRKLAAQRSGMPVNREVMEAFQAQVLPEVSLKKLLQSDFTFGISWWSIVEIEKCNQNILEKGTRNGLSADAMVKLIRKRADEYLKLDHLR